MERTITLSEDQVNLLEKLLRDSQETPEQIAVRERAEQIDHEIYSLQEVRERLGAVIETVIPDSEEGLVVKPIVQQWLDFSLQAQVGAKMLRRDAILEYTDEEIGKSMDDEMLLDDAADWMSFYARRARQSRDEETEPLESVVETDATKASSRHWFRSDSLVVAALGVIGGIITGVSWTTLTFR